MSPWTRRPGCPGRASGAGGRLNLAHNAVTRWARRAPDRTAVVWEGDDGSTREWTYARLERETAYAAATLARPRHPVRRQRRPVPADDPRDGLALPRLRMARSDRGPALQRIRRGRDRRRGCATATPRFWSLLTDSRGAAATVAMKAVADEAAAQLPSLEHILVVPQLGDADVRDAGGPRRHVRGDARRLRQRRTAGRRHRRRLRRS